jgi:hypothetical protein
MTCLSSSFLRKSIGITLLLGLASGLAAPGRMAAKRTSTPERI